MIEYAICYAKKEPKGEGVHENSEMPFSPTPHWAIKPIMGLYVPRLSTLFKWKNVKFKIAKFDHFLEISKPANSKTAVLFEIEQF